MSERAVSQNFPEWDELENSYRAWRPVDDDDQDSLNKFGVQKIIVPIQFATLQTILTFLMEVFTALPPVLKCRGAEPSSMRAGRVMELCLDYDYRGNRGYFTLNQWLMNVLRYGYGIIRNEWGVNQVLRKVLSPGPSSSWNLGGENYPVQGPMRMALEYFTTFEGNKWEVVDNRSWFWDVRYPLSRFQEGNFVFERDMVHDHDLHDLEQQGILFNTTEIKSTSQYGSVRGSETPVGSHQRDNYGNRASLDTALTMAKKNKMHLRERGIMKIIPRMFGLSNEERPIDYVIEIEDDTYITRCEPSTFLPRFPYSVCESYPDILATMSQGIMKLTQPLAKHLDFLFNSHMANVRKAVNDRFLVDPLRIDIKDFLDPENILIRLLPGAYGTNPAESLQQLSVVDITKNHMQDIQSVIEFWEQITGATRHMFGQISTGRRTAFELQGVFRQAGARMKMMADLISWQGMSPLTEQMALLRQENMSMDQFMEIAGQTAKDLEVDPEDIVQGFIKVSRDHLDGVFKFPAQAGALPQDRASAAEALDKMFDRVVQAPFLMQVFDPVEIFKEQIRQENLPNLDDFLQRGIRAQTMIMTPEQLGELYAKNKIQPFGGMPSANGTKDRSQPLTLEGALGGAGSERQ